MTEQPEDQLVDSNSSVTQLPCIEPDGKPGTIRETALLLDYF